MRLNRSYSSTLLATFLLCMPLGAYASEPVKQALDQSDRDDLLKNAKQMNLEPIPLVDNTAANPMKSVAGREESERRLVDDLWDSSIQNSPDILFVWQRLTGTLNRLSPDYARARSLMRIALGPVIWMVRQTGHVDRGFLEGLSSEQLGCDKSRVLLSSDQYSSLYNVLRIAACDLTLNLRDYQTFSKSCHFVNGELIDSEAMLVEAQHAGDAAQIAELKYSVRKNQRWLDCEIAEAQRYRKKLVDLSGRAAVNRLDAQLDKEGRLAPNMDNDGVANSFLHGDAESLAGVDLVRASTL